MDTGGINAIKPKKREANQKAEQVEAWLNEEYPAIYRKAKAENAEIFWGDETAVQNVANYARGYDPKGKTPVVKVQAKKMHINMISINQSYTNIKKLVYLFIV